MDVKNIFLNNFINEEVYVEQPQGYENHKFSDYVFKLKKVLYGLKQAPKAWYECLKIFLLKNNFKIRKVDSTLFSKINKHGILIVQVFVDDIIFG